MTIELIWAQDQSGGIGKKGGLPWNILEDLKNFKKITLGHPVIMGRKTWQSLPFKPLPDRRNVVLSSQNIDGVESYDSADSCISALQSESIKKLFVIGGRSIYETFYPKASVLHLTIITNGMFKLQDKWKELLRECKHVVFFVSIDACGELCERVREGSKWETVVETVEDLETEWPVTINTVIHKDNVKGIDDLKKWIDKRPWQINILTFPTHLRVSSDDKQRITRNFNQYFTYTI